MQPRVEKFVKKLDTLIGELDERIRTLLAADADLDLDTLVESGHADLPVDPEKEESIRGYHKSMKELKCLCMSQTHSRYVSISNEFVVFSNPARVSNPGRVHINQILTEQ